MNITLAVVAAAIALLLIYDVIIVLKKGGSATISWQMWSISKQYPVIPFAIGFIMGHIFFVQNCHGG